MRRWWFILLCCWPIGGWAAGIEVHDAWVRMPPPVADTAAAYMRIVNHRARAVDLVAVVADVAAHTMFHGRDMRPLTRVHIAAGGEFRFAPGQAHLMLMRLAHPLQAGDVVEFELHAADGTTIRVQAPVRDMRKLD